MKLNISKLFFSCKYRPSVPADLIVLGRIRSEFGRIHCRLCRTLMAVRHSPALPQYSSNHCPAISCHVSPRTTSSNQATTGAGSLTAFRLCTRLASVTATGAVLEPNSSSFYQVRQVGHSPSRSLLRHSTHALESPPQRTSQTSVKQ
jgi:hypothetical protein